MLEALAEGGDVAGELGVPEAGAHADASTLDVTKLDVGGEGGLEGDPGEVDVLVEQLHPNV